MLVSPASSGPGSALLFDRSQGDIIVVPHSADLSFGSVSHATFELWFILTDDPHPGIVHWLGKRGQCWNNADLNYQLAGDYYGFGLGSLYCGAGIPSWPASNRWTHIAVTCDGDSFRMYLDGQLQSAGACSFGGENLAPLVIGGSSSCGNTFPGAIDEVRIWNVARTQEEIAEYMYCVIDQPLAGLIGCWHFDEDSENQNVLDSSGWGHSGTLGVDADPSAEDPVRIPSTAPIAQCGPTETGPTSWGAIKAIYR